MATCFLAPESARPLSVTSESFFRQSNFFNQLPGINSNKNHCLFGEEYERELCYYLAKHIQVNCTDDYCLIGEEYQWSLIIQERLFLNKNIYFIDCNLHHNQIKKQLSEKKFDRIILLNCLEKLNTSFIHLFYKSLNKSGRLMIIHREPISSTLPLPNEVLPKWMNEHENCKYFFEQIYRHKRNNIEICEKEETLKFIMDKLQWFSLIYNQMFYPLNLINQQQITDGLREMNETYLKYHHGLIEIYDRLLFITVESTLPIPVKSSKKQINSILFHPISITNEIKEMLTLREQYQKKDLYKSSIQFMS